MELLEATVVVDFVVVVDVVVNIVVVVVDIVVVVVDIVVVVAVALLNIRNRLKYFSCGQ